MFEIFFLGFGEKTEEKKIPTGIQNEKDSVAILEGVLGDLSELVQGLKDEEGQLTELSKKLEKDSGERTDAMRIQVAISDLRKKVVLTKARVDTIKRFLKRHFG